MNQKPVVHEMIMNDGEIIKKAKLDQFTMTETLQFNNTM
jgi:hypothetical protein